MTIATNNGVPLIRDGKVVTSCSCCGGWFCYSPAAGACCNGTQCRVVQQCDCDTENGEVWFGAGTTCAGGACCNGTSCRIVERCGCDTENGEVFKGFGTVCDPNPCCLDSSGNPCGLLPNAGRPSNVYLTISGTGSVTLNRTYELTWSQQDFGWRNDRNSQGFLEDPIVRYGDSPCSRASAFGGCLPVENSPSFRVSMYVQVISPNNYQIVASYEDYVYLPFGACNCTRWSVFGGFSNFPLCWGCDPSTGDSITGSIASYQASHGEVQQQNPVAILSVNPLP